MPSTALRFPDGPVSDDAGTPYVMRGIELATSFVTGADPDAARAAPELASPRSSSRASSSASWCAPCSARRAWSPSPEAGTRPACWRPRRGPRGVTACPCRSPPPIGSPACGDVNENAWQDTDRAPPGPRGLGAGRRDRRTRHHRSGGRRRCCAASARCGRPTAISPGCSCRMRAAGRS